MTDRHAGYVVTLTKDTREDDAQAIINAIRMIRGVSAVEPVLGSFELQIAEQRAGEKWRARVFRVLDEDRP